MLGSAGYRVLEKNLMNRLEQEWPRITTSVDNSQTRAIKAGMGNVIKTRILVEMGAAHEREYDDALSLFSQILTSDVNEQLQIYDATRKIVNEEVPKQVQAWKAAIAQKEVVDAIETSAGAGYTNLGEKFSPLVLDTGTSSPSIAAKIIAQKKTPIEPDTQERAHRV